MTIPEQFTGASAWVGEEIEKTPEDWIHTLSVKDINEIEHAAKHYLSLNRDIGEISKQDFPLGDFENKIHGLKNVLLQGCGFTIIRGLPIESYTQAFAATVFCGIGCHIGLARSQNAQGHILGHVRDTGADASDPNSRIYQTNERQTFHTDSADVVGLLCVKKAKSGGDSLLVSAESIYNRMRATKPELLALLFDPIATDRRGEIPKGEKPFTQIPVLNWYDQKLTVYYQRQYIDSAQRFPDAMKLTSNHTKALDLFDSTANDPRLHLSMSLEPGDMQFVYNHSQLHDRTGFLDWPAQSARRHMMRLWLSIENDRQLPPIFAERYGKLDIGNRGGIVTSKTRLHAPLD